MNHSIELISWRRRHRGSDISGAIRTVSPKHTMIGTVLEGRYRLTGLAGKGSFSRVYKAYDEANRNFVAIKIIHSHALEDKESYARFLREIEVLRQLNHPNIVRFISSGSLPDGRLYVIEEFVEGQTLDELMSEQGKIAPDRVLRLLKQCCDALAHAHMKGVVHRDLKPNNIGLVTGVDGRESVKVFDFGLAKMLNSSEGTLTPAGRTSGTPRYMSPEQCCGLTVDARSDVYALGCLMYELLTARSAIEGEDDRALMRAQVCGPPPKFQDEDLQIIPASCQWIVLQCLQKWPEKRFQTMNEFLQALQAAGTSDSAFASFANARGAEPKRLTPAAVVARITTLAAKIAKLPVSMVPRAAGQ